MSTNPETLTPPAWNAHTVAFINGTYDKRIDTGEEFDTRTLADLFNAGPACADKLVGPAFLPSSYHEYDARSHDAQRERGQFVALTADIDSGDHTPKAVQTAVADFVGGAAYLIYSSPHSRPGDRRWRVVVPLDQAVPFDQWFDAQTALFAFLGAKGIETDKALARAGQLVFLPNVPATHVKTGTPLRNDENEPLYYQRTATSLTKPGLKLTEGAVCDGMAAIQRKRAEDEKKREAMRAEAEQRRANKPRGTETSLIDDFNASNSVATMLEVCGYEQSPRDARDWKSPLQSGDTYATRIMDDGTWFSLSQSDTDAKVGQQCRMGCFGDAYDLYAHFKHGGDHKAAYRAIGEERRGNVIRPSRFNTPEWMQEVPLPDEMPDYVQDAEFDIDPDDFAPVGASTEGDSDTFELLDIDELENLPPPQWLVKELVVEDGLTILYGDPGSGKSFIGLDMALRLTLGMDWHGFDTRQTGVLYIAGEGARGLGKRVKGWRREHKTEGVNSPFLLLPVPVALLEPDQRAKLLRTITEAKRRADFDIGLVVIDTVSRSLAGAGENGADEMGAFVAACDIIRMHTGGAVLGVHHSGKDKDKGMRGSSVLLGACDGTIRVEKSEDIVTLKTEKQKDAEEAAPLYMSMKKVSWPAPDGEQTTLVPYRTEQRPVSQESMGTEQVAKAFQMLNEAWQAGRPLSHSPQVRNQGRYAPSVIAKAVGCGERLVASHITSWLENECLAIEVYDQHSKSKGLRVVEFLGKGAGL